MGVYHPRYVATVCIANMAILYDIYQSHGDNNANVSHGSLDAALGLEITSLSFNRASTDRHMVCKITVTTTA